MYVLREGVNGAQEILVLPGEYLRVLYEKSYICIKQGSIDL